MTENEWIEARNALGVLAVLTEMRPGNAQLNALDTLTRALKVRRDDTQALADMQALDEWRAQDFGHRRWVMCEAYDYDGLLSHHCCRLIWEGASKDYAGATSDEARAKAAAWVREKGR